MSHNLNDIRSQCMLLQAGSIEVVPEGAYAVAKRPTNYAIHACVPCEGQAHIAHYDERNYRYIRPCPGALLDRRMELYNKARIPARYAHAQLSTFTPTHASHPAIMEELGAYLHAFTPGDPGKIFMGDVGTGKTHLLVATLRHLTLNKGIPCRFIEFTHLLSNLREQYSQNKGEGEILGPLAEIPVLAIDELGKGRNSDFERRILDELISRRYNDASLTTLFTTNYHNRSDSTVSFHAPQAASKGREYLGDRIGARVESRIYEMCEFVSLAGEDFRVRLHHNKM